MAGLLLVIDRLLAIKRLSRKMGLKGKNGLRSSGHILHEVKSRVRAYAKHNSECAITLIDLMKGIAAEKFPLWVAMTAPQFGFKGAERGGMLSRVKADRTMAKDLHKEAIETSQELESRGLGAGINIWWPAWASRRLGNPQNPPMEFDEAWDTMHEFWVDVLGTTGGTMWLEWKPGDPGSDYLMTLALAIRFCQSVNKALGRKALLINNEFAHILLEGLTVADGVKTTVDAELFFKFLHANSGQQTSELIQSQLDRGVKPGDVMIGTDQDWPLGVAGDMSEGMKDTKTWKDQQRAIGIMDRVGQPAIYCEHDVNPAGEKPEVVFELSIRNRMAMLENERELAA